MPGAQPGVRRPGYALLVATDNFCFYPNCMVRHMLCTCWVMRNAMRQHQWPELCKDTGVSCQASFQDTKRAEQMQACGHLCHKSAPSF